MGFAESGWGLPAVLAFVLSQGGSAPICEGIGGSGGRPSDPGCLQAPTSVGGAQGDKGHRWWPKSNAR